MESFSTLRGVMAIQTQSAYASALNAFTILCVVLAVSGSTATRADSRRDGRAARQYQKLLQRISQRTHGRGAKLIGISLSARGGPSISTVSAIIAAQQQNIVIRGTGFGTHLAFSGDSKEFQISDLTRGWNAGNDRWPGGGDWVTVDVKKWTNTEIVVSGFGGDYDGGWSLANGDKVEIDVWNAQTGRPGTAAAGAPVKLLGSGYPTRVPCAVATCVVGGMGFACAPKNLRLDELYVTTTAGWSGGRIELFKPDAKNKFQTVLSIHGSKTKLADPAGLALDGQGRLYVANRNNSTITIYKPDSSGDSSPVAVISGNQTGLDGPIGIAVRKGCLYVANNGNSSVTEYKIVNIGIGRNDLAPFKTIKSTDIQGSTGDLTCPHGLACDGNGTVYVSSLLDKSVKAYEPDGDLLYSCIPALKTVNLPPTASSAGAELPVFAILDLLAAATDTRSVSIGTPYGIAVTSGGVVYVGDELLNCISKISLGANGKAQLDGGIYGSLAEINSPQMMALDRRGYLYVVVNGGVNIYDTTKLTGSRTRGGIVPTDLQPVETVANPDGYAICVVPRAVKAIIEAASASG